MKKSKKRIGTKTDNKDDFKKVIDELLDLLLHLKVKKGKSAKTRSTVIVALSYLLGTWTLPSTPLSSLPSKEKEEEEEKKPSLPRQLPTVERGAMFAAREIQTLIGPKASLGQKPALNCPNFSLISCWVHLFLLHLRLLLQI